MQKANNNENLAVFEERKEAEVSLKVKFLCRLGKNHKQQIRELIPSSIHERVIEEVTVGTRLYQESGLPPFAYFYEDGQEVVGFFLLLSLLEEGEELLAEGRYYWKEGKEFCPKDFVELLKEEYKEIAHLSLLSEVEKEAFSIYSRDTECFMRKGAHKTCITDNSKENAEIVLEECKQTDEEAIAFYLSILTDVFSMDYEEAMAHRAECLADDCEIYIATRKGKKIGTCGVYLGEKSNTIFDIAIVKLEQGKGYGRALLEEFLTFLETSQKDTILQVSTKSEAAFYLYQKLGFEIEQQLIIYEIW